MKKFLAALTVVVLLGLAGAQKFGIYMDYAGYAYKIPVGVTGFGGYYPLNEKMRVGGGLEMSFGVNGIGGRIDYIMDRVALFKEPIEVDLYYGGEAGLTLFFGSTMLTQLNLGGLLGFEYVFPNSKFGVFSELIMGPSFIFGSGVSSFGFGYGGKLGVNFY